MSRNCLLLILMASASLMISYAAEAPEIATIAPEDREILEKYSGTIRDLLEDVSADQPIPLPEDVPVEDVSFLAVVVRQLEEAPTGLTLQQIADLFEEDATPVSPLSLLRTATFLDLQVPRVITSGMLKAVVDKMAPPGILQRYTPGVLRFLVGDSVTINDAFPNLDLAAIPPDILSELAKLYYLKHGIFLTRPSGEKLQPVRGFSVAELTAFGKVPPIVDGRLDLSARNIDDLEGLELLPNVEELRELNLSHNELREVSERFPLCCPQLEVLNLTHNKLQSLPDNFLTWSKQLQVIRLGHNQLRTLPKTFLWWCADLEILMLENNMLTSLPEDFIKYNGKLKMLWLIGNQLSAEQLESVKQRLRDRGINLDDPIVSGLTYILEPQQKTEED